MHHITFNESSDYQAAILIKTAALKKKDLLTHYVEPLGKLGVPDSDLISFNLVHGPKGKAPVSLIKEHLQYLLPALDGLSVTTLLVCDGDYFKKLTGVRTSAPHYGYVRPCVIPGYEHMSVILGLNYQSLFYNPDNQCKLDQGLTALADHLRGTHVAPGSNIIHSEYYPQGYDAIAAWLNSLHQYPQLTCDIEAFSLRFYKAGLGTVSLAWDEHNGGAFMCDYSPVVLKQGVNSTHDGYPCRMLDGVPYYAENLHNKQIKQLFRKFLTDYQGQIIWHNAGYDVKVLVYELWMEHPHDDIGMQDGLEIMTRRIHDTQIISYLATNSCAGNKLSLKEQAHEFAGNYAQADINDILRIKPDVLLRYNLVDSLSTWYVYRKNHKKMVQDDQLDVYNRIFIPSIKLLLQMELTGIPMNMERVEAVDALLTAERETQLSRILISPVTEKYMRYRRTRLLISDLDARREKAKNPEKIKERPDDHFNHVQFNPNSTPQLQEMFYQMLDYPVYDTTKNKQPATGAKTLQKLLANSKDPEHSVLLEALIAFFEVDKILGTFIKAFYEKSHKIDDWYYLFGSFKLGGTVSGRLSSNSPNLQNMPSTGSKYAKLIKSCFQAPPGWLLAGADFASLEDRISALTTKDPMKLEVYTEGYDGHCLRAFYYFGTRMPDIQAAVSAAASKKEAVSHVNSIKKLYGDLRQDSKPPTFLLTYGGTYHGLMGLGFTEKEAKEIEMQYHRLYVVSDRWVADKIQRACKDGYVTVAFGLRLRTPVLSQTILGNGRTPYEAESESRTAGNALGQSYGMLNNRAGIALQQKTLNSVYRYDILPVAHIHDAQYFMVRNNVSAVKWLNDHIVPEMEWQELPEIQHDEVKLGGELDIFHPTWANDITLNNNSSLQDIADTCRNAD